MKYLVTYYDDCRGEYHQLRIEARNADAAACQVEARDDCTKVCVVAQVTAAQAAQLLARQERQEA